MLWLGSLRVFTASTAGRFASGIRNDAYGIMIETNRLVNSFSIIGDAISIVTKAQLRAARALLEWTQSVLSERSGVSLPTIKRLEPGNGVLSANHQTVLALEQALEAAGVEFINGERPGVRLRNPGSVPTAPANVVSKRAAGPKTARRGKGRQRRS